MISMDSGLHDACAAFLVPRIGARPGSQQARFDPLATVFDIDLVQDRPDRLFAHAGPARRVHAAHAMLANRHRVAQQQDFFIGLVQAREMRDFLPLDDVVTQRAQLVRAARIELVDGDAPVAARVTAHQVIVEFIVNQIRIIRSLNTHR